MSEPLLSGDWEKLLPATVSRLPAVVPVPVGAGGLPADGVGRIGGLQRRLAMLSAVAALLGLLALAFRFVGYNPDREPLIVPVAAVPVLAVLAVVLLLAWVTTLKLASWVCRPYWAAVLLATLVPGGLLPAVLWVNRRATLALRDRGVRAGFFGAPGDDLSRLSAGAVGSADAPDIPAARLFAIARVQRQALVLIGVWALYVASALALALALPAPGPDSDAVGLILVGLYSPLKVAGVVLSVRLAGLFRGRAGTATAGLAALLLSFVLVLLVLNRWATAALRRNGVRVGLLGTRRADVERFDPSPPRLRF